ncbi:MAG TPA: serine/threonine-protein kinase [Polyangiales bacterium]|nr:serine/threonine-protein kinase [Polyangiales bacterium]
MPRLPITEPSVRSVPRDTEEGRALLQSRLAGFGRLGAVLSGVFFVLGLAITLVEPLPGAYTAVGVQAICVALSVPVAYLERIRPLGGRWLVAIDLGYAWASASCFVALGLALPLYARPEAVMLLCAMQFLAARAFLVPSTARRTALVGLVPLGVIVACTYALYRDAKPHPDAPGAIEYCVLAAVLGSGPVVVTTLTSRTIFGLRERAREAMQLGQYTLLEKLGAGGMGVVYKARHATLRRPTAIKLLPVERAGAQNLTRFEREVQLTSQLTHPNTVAIFDYGRSADGILYYAMEFLDGLDLDSVVRIGGPLPAPRVVHVMSQVAEALAEAHEAGLLHRDIKPQNVILCRRGGLNDFAKVVDFGLVKDLQSAGDASMSAVNTIIGTPLYMSPESIAKPSTVDARSDLYALGALGYFLITGTPPFRGDSVVEICSQHLHAAVEPPSQRLGAPVPPALEEVLLACLAKNREQRPASASDLATLLAVSSWTRRDADAWWREHAEQVSAVKRERSAAASERASTVPIATVAVDLRQRGSQPWQSGAGE